MPEAASNSSVQNVILIVLALVIIAISVWSLYAFVRAILLFIFSQWKEDKIKKAWNSIRFMIMGIFLTVFLLFTFPLIFKWMWIENPEEYSAKSIFNKAWELLNKSLQIKDVILESQKENQYDGDLYYDDNFSDQFSEDYSL